MKPTFYHPSDVEKLYAPRSAEIFTSALHNRTANTAHNDLRKVALLIVDGQWDFVSPTGCLPVPGAVADMRRLIEFIYGNLGSITEIIPSKDTHLPFQIFFPSVWRDRQGNPPDGYQVITYEDMHRGIWKNIVDPKWALEYVKKLETQANKPLMIWPFHCLQGTPGCDLVPALSEAVFFHSIARASQPTFLSKGTNKRVEHYGIFKAEVEDPGDISTQLNTQVLDTIAKNDLIYVAGEAKSHCVLSTMTQLVDYFGSTQPEAIKKVRFLMDCTSSVQHPTIPFEDIANEALAEMVLKGVVLVNSTDPIK
jgi:nicotinamidase-related amidase